MFVIIFILCLFNFLFNLLQLIAFHDTLKLGLIKAFFEEDKNISYRNKKYIIRK